MENFNTNYVYEHELAIELDDPYNVIHSPKPLLLEITLAVL